MEKAVVLEDAPVLIPNPAHQNLIKCERYIPKGTEVEGIFASIEGKRQGKPFAYRIFKTTEGDIIFQKFVKQQPTRMETTEVKLGADAQVSPTVVNVPAGASKKVIVTGVVIGAGLGYGFARWKKYDRKKTLIAVVIGAGIGYGAAQLYAKRSVKVKESK